METFFFSNSGIIKGICFSLPMRDGNDDNPHIDREEYIVLAYLWGMETSPPRVFRRPPAGFSLPMRDGNYQIKASQQGKPLF